MMNHIRYFEDIDTDGSLQWRKKWPEDLINDLEDCLQETFDKFSIIEWQQRPGVDWNVLNWRNEDNTKITISKIPKFNNRLNPIYYELLRMQPMIEKRIGYHIKIEIVADYSHEYNIDIYPKEKIRTSLFSNFIKRFK